MRPKILKKPITIDELLKAKEVWCNLDIIEEDGKFRKKLLFRPQRDTLNMRDNHPYFSKFVLYEYVNNPKLDYHVKELDTVDAERALFSINTSINRNKEVKYFSDPKYLSGYRTRAPPEEVSGQG